VRRPVGQPAPLRIAITLVSAIMAAVSSPRPAIPLAQTGGLAFIHQGQPPAEQAEQAEMVGAVKRHKTGFRHSAPLQQSTPLPAGRASGAKTTPLTTGTRDDEESRQHLPPEREGQAQAAEARTDALAGPEPGTCRCIRSVTTRPRM
jgi:IMP dehydrogenase/GMP reductase